MEKKKIWLNEVLFIRPILLFLLVSYHAFAPYCGAWPMPDGIHSVDSYRWIALFSRAFLLEAFVFISGYIFTFQLMTKHKYGSIKEVAFDKMNRLLIPCVFFGVLYYMFFCNNSPLKPTKILAGIGHLWYLPCLFWLFIMQYYIIEVKKPKVINHRGVFILITVLPLFSIVPFPFQLNKALYYMLFFYGGGLFYQYKVKIENRTNSQNTMLMWVIFIIMTFTVNTAMEFIQETFCSSNSVIEKCLGLAVNLYLKIALAWIGIMALYQTAVLYCRKFHIGKFVIKIGMCGYGVYVFHQFVLVHFYEQTSLPQMLGSLWLPFVSLFGTTLISVVLTLLIRQTKLGRKYL